MVTGCGKPRGSVVGRVRRTDGGARRGRRVDREQSPREERVWVEFLGLNGAGEGISRKRRGDVLHARRGGGRGEEVEEILEVVRRRDGDRHPEDRERSTPGTPGSVDGDRVAGGEAKRHVRAGRDGGGRREAGALREAAGCDRRGQKAAVGARGGGSELESRPSSAGRT